MIAVGSLVDDMGNEGIEIAQQVVTEIEIPESGSRDSIKVSVKKFTLMDIISQGH